MENRKINVTELDFDKIKTNLKTFLQGQSKFSDYDFEGSTLSILLDILAYNTHYNALYTNLAVNESFLDSASKRNNVVSLAKMLGYIPTSASCPTAAVDVIVTNPSITPASIILPKYTPLDTSFNGMTYRFYTVGDVNASYDSTNASYTFSNVEIKEGSPLTFSYTVSEGQRYLIPNTYVDLNTLKVTVQESSTSSNTTVFYRQENLLQLTSSDPVYFVKEIEGELYELEFGNGVLGKALKNGNIVKLEYMATTALDQINGSKVFTYQGSTTFVSPSITSGVSGTVSVVTKSYVYGGYDKEDMETVRYNAPRAYISQNRGVTATDYKNLILALFSEAKSVNVWGGEDNVPPQYGKVFIAVKPKSSEVLTSYQKETVLSLIKSKNVVSITPEIVDPDYISLAINLSVYYNPRLTNKTEAQLKALINQSIIDYNTQYLDSYDGIFRYSNFSTSIDKTDKAIVSNISTMLLHRQITPKYNITSAYNIEFGNPIYWSGEPEECIISNGFYISGNSNIVYLEDLPSATTTTGVFRIYYMDGTNKIYVEGTYGTIDYATGSIAIQNVNISGLVENYFNLIIKPQSYDVVSVRNQLVTIDPAAINITMIVDRISAGDAAGNSSYIFTSSRN